MAFLDKVGKRKKLCLRSKRWWDDEIREKQKELQEVRRGGTREEVRKARKAWFRLVRRKKRTMWQEFVGNADEKTVWLATRHTTGRGEAARPRMLHMEEGRVIYDAE